MKLFFLKNEKVFFKRFLRTYRAQSWKPYYYKFVKNLSNFSSKSRDKPKKDNFYRRKLSLGTINAETKNTVLATVAKYFCRKLPTFSPIKWKNTYSYLSPNNIPERFFWEFRRQVSKPCPKSEKFLLKVRDFSNKIR